MSIIRATPPRHSPSSSGNRMSRPGRGLNMSTKLLHPARIASMIVAAMAFTAIASFPQAAAQQDAARDAQRDAQHDSQRDSWPELADGLFQGRRLADGTGV